MLRLRKDVTREIARGHPWIWADALTSKPGGAPRIDDVVDATGQFCARGVVDPTGPIAVRVLVRDPDVAVDEAFVRGRIADALALRARVLPDEVDARRLVHGEADLLPGVVVDRYLDTSVVRFDAPAVRETLGPFVTAALVALVPGRLVERRPEERGPERPLRVLHGPDPDDEIVVHEGPALVGVDVRRGQKTGLFLDQRDNHLRVAALCGGARVLSLFSYTGGFGLAAAVAGAAEVTSVDSAAPVLQAARDNFARNDRDPARHRFVAADAFRFAAEARRDPARWDVVVVDPPSLAPSDKAVPRALAAYRRVCADATALLADGGLLVASSCSSHVTESAFLGAAAAGAASAGRILQVLEVRGAGPDHPLLPAFPEGRYLKLLIARPTALRGRKS